MLNDFFNAQYYLSWGILVATIVISKSLMLDKFRVFVDRRWPYVGYALKCGFCTAGWIALIVTVFTNVSLSLFNNEIAGFFIRWFSLWGMATLWYVLVWPTLKEYAPKLRLKARS